MRSALIYALRSRDCQVGLCLTFVVFFIDETRNKPPRANPLGHRSSRAETATTCPDCLSSDTVACKPVAALRQPLRRSSRSKAYLNNSETRRLEIEPVRGPLVAHVFEWYARGDVSLKKVTRLAGENGLTHPRAHRRLAKSEIHRILRNPIYAGDFLWKGKRYEGNHQPLISKILFETVQEVFESANRPKYTKHRHAFAGLVACGRCGCAMTADVKKGRYV